MSTSGATVSRNSESQRAQTISANLPALVTSADFILIIGLIVIGFLVAIGLTIAVPVSSDFVVQGP